MKKTIKYAVLILSIAFLIGYISFRNATITARVILAQEQIEIFDEMINSSENASVEDAIGSMEYAMNYYPSGTKQIKGSRLDKIVEMSRKRSIQCIIELLKIKTGESLGDDPQQWIEKYH